MYGTIDPGPEDTKASTAEPTSTGVFRRRGRHARRGALIAWLLVVALVGAGLAGCGSSSQGPTQVASVQSMTHPQIVANEHGSNPDAFYQPDPIRVRVGQTIVWTNKDADLHDVTSETGAFASGPMGYGGTFRWTPTKPGVYRYFCTLHPEMHGEVIVR